MSSLNRAWWAVVSAVFLATAIFVPIRIRYRQNEKPVPKPGAVSIADYTFVPGVLEVEGSPVKVTFENTDGTTHTATADDGSFDSGKIPAGQSFDVTVTGTVSFHCAIHSSMTATITVKA